MQSNSITKSIESLMELLELFYECDEWLRRENIHDFYMSEIISEIEEVKAEVRKDNEIHLEDELSDVLWDYVALLFVLQKNGYIKRVENIFEHAVDKYSERLGFLHLPEGEIADAVKFWNTVKKKQKENLQKRAREKASKK